MTESRDSPALTVVCSGFDKDRLQALERLQTLTGAEDDRLERLIRHVDRHLCLLGEQNIQPGQHSASARKGDAVAEHILDEVGRRRTETLDYSRYHAPNVFVDPLPYLLGRNDHVFGHAGSQVSPTQLRLLLVRHGEGRADRDLDALGRALADRNRVLAAHKTLNRGVEVETTQADRGVGHYPPH